MSWIDEALSEAHDNRSERHRRIAHWVMNMPLGVFKVYELDSVMRIMEFTDKPVRNIDLDRLEEAIYRYRLRQGM